MASGSAFGTAFDKETIAAMLEDPEEEIAVEASEEAPEETPPPEESTEAPEEEAEALPSAEEAPGEEAEAEEAPDEPAPEPLLLGRYKTPEDLANAYQELRGLQQRVAEESHAKDAEIEEMKALLTQAAQALQGQQQPQLDPQMVAWAEQQGFDPSVLPVLQQYAAQAAEAKIAPMQQQLEAQKAEAERQAAYQEQVSAVQGFRSKHPEIVPDSTEDNRHAEVFQALREDPQIKLQWTEETLETALEAAQDPDFYSIIRANPALIDTDEGLDYARWQATLKKGTQAAQTQAQQKQDTKQREAAARKAHVETGSAAPTASPEEEDVVDLAFALPQRESPFFR